MKTILTSILVTITLMTTAQDEKKSLFEKSNHIGGFGGSSLIINEDGEYIIGGEGAWIFSNFYFGGFGYGKDLGNYYSNEQDKNYDVTHSAGGLLIGAFSNTTNRFALYTETRIAFGDIVARLETAPNNFEEFSDNTLNITPIAGLTLTPTDFIQFRVFGGYQFASKVDLAGIGNDPIQGAVFGFGIFFGAFNY